MIITVPEIFENRLGQYLEGFADRWRELVPGHTIVSRIALESTAHRNAYLRGKQDAEEYWAHRYNDRLDKDLQARGQS